MNWKLAAGQDSFWKNKKVLKIQFPEFWQISLQSQNAFYQMVQSSAQNFVETFNRGQEFLTEELLHEFWHEHCDFCTDKITTENNCVVYCTEDFYCWICSECFEEFKEQLNITVINQ